MRCVSDVMNRDSATPESRLLSQQYDVQSSDRSADEAVIWFLPPFLWSFHCRFLIFSSETFLLFIHHNNLRQVAPEWFVLGAVPFRFQPDSFHYNTCRDESAEICQIKLCFKHISVRVSQFKTANWNAAGAGRRERRKNLVM